MHIVGIIGIGHLGEFHLQQWMTILPKDKILCLEQNTIRKDEIRSKYAIDFVDSLEQLLAVCTIIDVVTPTNSHFEYASNAIKAFKHVFIEKPICDTLTDAKKLVDLAYLHKVKVQIGHVERYNPAYKSIQKLLTNPKFFEVHRLAPYNPRGTEVSVILDLMIHDIDIICHLVNAPVSHVYANGVSILNKSNDIANARIEFENGCVANLTASRISMKQMRKMRIFGDAMYATIDFLNKTSEYYQIESIDSLNEGMPFEQYDGTKKKLIYSSPVVPTKNAIQEELKDFYQTIVHDLNPIISALDGYKALELALNVQMEIEK